MGKEENTRDARIRRIIKEEVQMPRTGIITDVYERTSTSDRFDFNVDVRIGPEAHPREVPVAIPAPDIAMPPRSSSHPEGPDLALVQYIDDDESERAVVTHILYNDEDRAPLGRQGIIRMRRGNLYFEMHENGDWGRLSKKSADDASPTMEIGIDDANNEITIKAGGNDIIMDSEGGDVKVKEGGTAQKVAVQGHDHDFTYDGAGQNSSTQSGTTNTPNQSGTETEIE